MHSLGIKRLVLLVSWQLLHSAIIKYNPCSKMLWKYESCLGRLHLLRCSKTCFLFWVWKQAAWSHAGNSASVCVSTGQHMEAEERSRFHVRVGCRFQQGCLKVNLSTCVSSCRSNGSAGVFMENAKFIPNWMFWAVSSTVSSCAAFGLNWVSSSWIGTN